MWVSMRHSDKFSKKALLLASILGLSAGATLAQTGGAADDAPATAEAEVRQIAEMTDAEMREQAEAIGAHAVRVSRRMMTMLDESRQDRDIIRVTCLNGRLTEAHATEGSIEARIVLLVDAIDSGNRGQRDHHYTVLVVLDRNVSQHERDGNACIGADAFNTGRTEVQTTRADGSPEDDIANIPDEQALPVPYIAPPASATM